VERQRDVAAQATDALGCDNHAAAGRDIQLVTFAKSATYAARRPSENELQALIFITTKHVP
jgi:hypothetical protein